MEGSGKKVEALDELVNELYDRFAKEMEQTEDGDVVLSMDKVLSPVWKRNEVIYHITFLELVNTQIPEKRPDLFEAYLMDDDLQEAVAKYEIQLRAALKEFNKQMILDKIRKMHRNYRLQDARESLPKMKGMIPYSELLAYAEKIENVWDDDAHSHLDKWYYSEAGDYFGPLSKIWKKLKDHDLGKLFILEQKDITGVHRGKVD